MICSKCGKQNKSGDFCVNCGIKIKRKREQTNIITIILLIICVLLVISTGVLSHLYIKSNKELIKYKSIYSNAKKIQNTYKEWYEKAYDLYNELYIEKYGEGSSFAAYRQFRQEISK